MWILILTFVASIAHGVRPLSVPGIETQVGGHENAQVSCGSKITGKTTWNNEEVIIEFTAEKENYIFDACASNFDTVLSIVDYEGHTISVNDDHNEGDCKQSNPNMKTSYMKSSLKAGQDYMLEITGFGGSLGDYDIIVSCPSNTEVRVGDHTNEYYFEDEAIGVTGNYVIFLLAIIGALTLVYWGIGAIHKRLVSTSRYINIEAEVEC